MNGFTKKNISALTLGEKLKKLRSDKRIALNEVARITKIQLSYLEYLEEGAYDKMPADVYVKGFLRSYADFLGVDEKILLRIYEREKDIKNNLEEKDKKKLPKVEKIDISSFVFTPKRIIFSVVAIIVLIGLFFLYREIDSFANEPSLLILNPSSDNVEILTNSIIVEGVTDKEAKLFINGQPILVNDEGKFRENLTLQNGLNAINIKAINKFNKETAKLININSNFEESKENENTEIKNEEKTFQIDLRVDPGPVWLKVEADGSLVFDGTMLSGAVQMFKAKEKIIVSSGKGEVTFVKFNGQEIGPLSAESGAAKGIVFTPETSPNVILENMQSPTASPMIMVTPIQTSTPTSTPIPTPKPKTKKK